MRSVVLAATLAASCATVPTRAARPLLSPDGTKPVQFAALGATYSVPARVGITDHDREPGMAWLDFVDQNTGCKGGLAFVAATNRNGVARQHERAVESANEFKKNGVESKLVERVQPMLGEKASVTVAELTTKTDEAAEVYFGLFLPEQQLFVGGQMYCDQPGFVDPQLQVLAQLIESQSR